MRGDESPSSIAGTNRSNFGTIVRQLVDEPAELALLLRVCAGVLCARGDDPPHVADETETFFIYLRPPRRPELHPKGGRSLPVALIGDHASSSCGGRIGVSRNVP